MSAPIEATNAACIPNVKARRFSISSFMSALLGDGCVGTPIVAQGAAGTI